MEGIVNIFESRARVRSSFAALLIETSRLIRSSPDDSLLYNTALGFYNGDNRIVL